MECTLSYLTINLLCNRNSNNLEEQGAGGNSSSDRLCVKTGAQIVEPLILFHTSLSPIFAAINQREGKTSLKAESPT